MKAPKRSEELGGAAARQSAALVGEGSWRRAAQTPLWGSDRWSRVVLLAVALSVHGQTPVGGTQDARETEVAGGVAQIQLATNALQLGRIAGGTTVRCTLTVTNAGQAPLEIKDVQPSCGCISVGEWPRSVAPGSSGAIPLQIRAPNLDSLFSKTVVISCSDPLKPQITVSLLGTLWKGVDITPPLVCFDFSGTDDTNTVKSVRLSNRLKEPLQLAPPELESTSFRADLKTVEPGQEFEVSIRCSSIPRQGSLVVPLKLRTSSQDLPVVNVSVVAVVPPPIEVKPARVVLLGTPPREFGVTIRNHLDTPLKLSSPQVNLPGVEVKLEETQPGQVFKLGLTFPAGFHLASWQHGKVTFQTTAPEHPKLEIPILSLGMASLR